MTFVVRLKRYVALKTYKTWQAWVYVKEDVIQRRQYAGFRCRVRISQGWPFHLLAKVLSRGVKNSKGFGQFGAEWQRLSVSSGDPIFDPKKDRLFSKQAALRAFEHVGMAGVDDNSRKGAAEQTDAEELKRVQAQLADAIRTMQAQEARRVARLKTIIGTVVVGLIVLVTVLLMG